MLDRKALESFESWKARSSSNALLVTGARQVGKSYLLQEFGRRRYEHVVTFDLVRDLDALRSFSQATSADDLAFRMSVAAQSPFVPGKTLVIVDEVQECPEVVTYIKYLVGRGDYDYALSGSLLGVQLENVRSFPVGYVTEVRMYPLDFQEFTHACGLTSEAWDVVRECLASQCAIPDFVHERLLQLFHRYLLVGGMPDAVNAYLDTGGVDAPRTVQENIREQYRRDITKYAPREERLVIRDIFDLIPAQLSQQNRRFKVSDISGVKRHERVADDFLWLAAAGVALPAYNVSRPAYPLVVNSQRKLLKLFSNDVGLLTGTFLKRDVAEILDGSVSGSLGGVYENFVAQELRACGLPLYYFTKKGIGELDLVTQRADGTVAAIEVKSGRGYRTHAALDNAMATEHYHIDEAYVLGECNVEYDGRVLYAPIYAAALLGAE